MGKRGQMVLDELKNWIWAGIVLLLVVVAIVIFTNSGKGALEFFKNIIRWGK